MPYADAENKKKILNEVSLMQHNKGDSILMIEEVFDFEEHLFLMVEMMDGSICDIIEDMDGMYSENCVKYICYKTLSGLKFLHESDVIHRDIKSDNILFNCQGEV